MNRREAFTTAGAAAACAVMPAMAADPELTVAHSRVVEMRDGKPVPYPDAAWNAYADGADAMWLDRQGRRRLPAAQLDRLAVLQGGTARVRFPVEVYTPDAGTKTPANDHL